MCEVTQHISGEDGVIARTVRSGAVANDHVGRAVHIDANVIRCHAVIFDGAFTLNDMNACSEAIGTVAVAPVVGDPAGAQHANAVEIISRRIAMRNDAGADGNSALQISVNRASGDGDRRAIERPENAIALIVVRPAFEDASSFPDFKAVAATDVGIRRAVPDRAALASR